MHTLIIGQTNSGKSTLAKILTHEYEKREIETMLFDPYLDDGWATHDSNRYADEIEFLNALAKTKNKAVFIDESPVLYDKYKDVMNGFLMRGRHQGLKFFLIAQRYKNIPPNSRGNAKFVYSFMQNPMDTKMIQEDYVKVGDLSQLKQFEYYHFTQFECTEKKKLDIHKFHDTLVNS